MKVTSEVPLWELLPRFTEYCREPSLYCLVNIAISWTKKLLQPIENCNIENYKYLNNEKRQKDGQKYEIIHSLLIFFHKNYRHH